MLIIIVFYSSVIFYAEQSESYFDNSVEMWKYSATDKITEFQSIPESMWWCIVTITTVGYGDAIPRTRLGKIVASMCMITAFLLLGLPISILSANFGAIYKEYHYKKQIERKKMMILQNLSKPRSMVFSATSNAELLADLQKDQVYLRENLTTLKNLIYEMDSRYDKVNATIKKITQIYEIN